MADARYDVAVVGGGLIGAAAALGIARQGRRVALLDPSPPRLLRDALGFDVRTVAVSPASRSLLESLDVWARLTPAPYRRMEVWEERGTQAMTFDATEVGRSELGWIIENGEVAVALWGALRDRENVTIIERSLTGVTPSRDSVALGVPEHPITASLVVAADGADSAIRRALGASVRRTDTGHMALATLVRSTRPHEGVALQRFLLDGPLALLPMQDPHVCSVVWSQSPDAATRRMALPATAFCVELCRGIQGRLGDIESTGRRVTFPLTQQLAQTFNPHPRVVLVGDAGRVLHPLAGLGANLGLEDVRELLAGAGRIPAGGDVGAAGLWRTYDRQRSARSQLLLAVMGGLRRIYGRGDPLTQWLRNAGVHWLNAAGPVKRQIMTEAMGLGPVGRGPHQQPGSRDMGHGT